MRPGFPQVFFFHEDVGKNAHLPQNWHGDLVWGHPYDSPNYQIVMQIFWQMGIFPNVIMEEDHLWKPWSHATLEEALSEMKNRLGLFDSQEWDEKLLDLLESRLLYQSGEYIWPSALRTALLYWDV